MTSFCFTDLRQVLMEKEVDSAPVPFAIPNMEHGVSLETCHLIEPYYQQLPRWRVWKVLGDNLLLSRCQPRHSQQIWSTARANHCFGFSVHTKLLTTSNWRRCAANEASAAQCSQTDLMEHIWWRYGGKIWYWSNTITAMIHKDKTHVKKTQENFPKRSQHTLEHLNPKPSFPSRNTLYKPWMSKYSLM